MNNLEALLELVELRQKIEEDLNRYEYIHRVLSTRHPKLEQMEEYNPKVLRRKINDIKNNHIKSDSIRNL